MPSINNSIFADAPTVALSFGSNLDPGNIAEGNDVYFECKISANPEVYKVVWLHNVRELLLLFLSNIDDQFFWYLCRTWWFCMTKIMGSLYPVPAWYYRRWRASRAENTLVWPPISKGTRSPIFCISKSCVRLQQFLDRKQYIVSFLALQTSPSAVTFTGWSKALGVTGWPKSSVPSTLILHPLNIHGPSTVPWKPIR